MINYKDRRAYFDLGVSKIIRRTVKITYICGCVVRLSGWGRRSAPQCCEHHGGVIIETITKNMKIETANNPRQY